MLAPDSRSATRAEVQSAKADFVPFQRRVSNPAETSGYIKTGPAHDSAGPVCHLP
ncbi:hypothetical protein SAMN05216486_101129 [bacterium JGI 053]|nr:hypothetical protein SAMN05216486_101129 [bacterium JGI 053]